MTNSSSAVPGGSHIPKQDRRLGARKLRHDDINVVDAPSMKRAISGAVVGNFMEWYDFGVYGYLATTLAQVFFAKDSKSLLVVLGLFAASFLVRPLGGFFFGPLGDRIGRQKTLAITMIMIALATAAIGLLPTYSVVGFWGAVLLLICKLLQGFSTGGEYAGATTFVSEYSPDNKRGFLSSFLDLGSYLGFAAGAGVVLICQLVFGSDAMLDWGWRIPFLLAVPLGAVALYFRLKIEETPAFQAELDAMEAKNSGDKPHGGFVAGVKQFFVTIRENWKGILIGIALVAGTNTAGYSLTSFMPSYLEKTQGLDSTMSTLATIPVLVVLSCLIPFVGALSDKIGRKPVYLMAALTGIVFTLPGFMLMGQHSFILVLLGLTLCAVPVLFYVAISASALPALFTTATRYAAMGIAYNVAVSAFGGTAPAINDALVEITKIDVAPAFYIMFFSLCALIALPFVKETAKRPMPGSAPSVSTQQEARDAVDHYNAHPETLSTPIP